MNAQPYLLQGLIVGALVLGSLLFTSDRPIGGVGDPPTLSPGSDYSVEVSSYARYRYWYMERDATPKEFHVCVTKTGECIFRRSYDLSAWDVSWQISWRSPTEADIEIFDFGPGVDHRRMSGDLPPHRLIGTLHLSIDAADNKVADRMDRTR